MRLSLVAPALLVMILPSSAEVPDPPAKSGIQRRLPGRVTAPVNRVWLVDTESAGKTLSAGDIDHLASGQGDASDVVQVPAGFVGSGDRRPHKVASFPAALCGRGPPCGNGVRDGGGSTPPTAPEGKLGRDRNAITEAQTFGEKP